MILKLTKKINKTIKQTLTSLMKLKMIEKIFIIFLILLFCFVILTNFRKNRYILENFDNDSILYRNNYFEIKNNDEIYDDFYCKYYDNLHLNKKRNNFEIGKILDINKENINNKYLDIGSGTGYHVNKLYSQNQNVIGVDKSPSMITKAKDNYPECSFEVGDILNNNIFEYNSFTHIICLGRTIYLIKDKSIFFENCYSLLEDGGYLIVNVIKPSDYNLFITNDSNNELYNSEKYGKKNEQLIVKFDNSIEYVSKYKKNKDLLSDIEEPYYNVVEKFENFETHSVRKNTTDLYMPKIQEIVRLANSKGFSLIDKISYSDIGYKNEYLYVFQK